MAIKKPLSELKLHPPYRVFRKGKDGVIGFDTESLVTGYAFLITDSLHNYCWIRSAEDVVAFLTNPSYAGSFNTFWNLDFDIGVLMKWLGFEFCKSLVKDGAARYGEVHFEYVPKRLLIVRKGKTWTTFNDAMQYYIPRSLDGAAKTYLNAAKVSVGSKEFHSSDYGREDLLKYCQYDSKLCRDLTQLLLEDLHDIGFSPTTLVSPGTIMEEAIVDAAHIPDVTKMPMGVLEYAYSSYVGGWMECFKRGHFPKLWDYDVSSAYPFQVSELCELDRGTWTYHKGEGSGLFGFVNCTVDIKAKVSPIVFQGDVNYTPIGRWNRILFSEEVDFIRKYRLGRVEVKDGWYFTPSAIATKPYYWTMRELFKQKERVRNKWLPKVLSVSVYGKFAQRFEDGRTGNLFNPIYASTITSRTRLQVARYALMLPEHLCMVTTDGLTFDAPLPASALSKGFGGLRLSHFSEGLIVGTNICSMVGKYPGGEWRPGRFNWLKLLNDEPDRLVFPLEQFRCTTLVEGVNRPSEFEKIGVFETFKYDFDLNYDHKRFALKVKCGRDLLENTYDSAPWEVSIPRRRKELWELRSD